VTGWVIICLVQAFLKRKILAGVTAAILLVALGLALLLLRHSPVPASVRKQLNFAAVYPSNTSTIDQNSYDYNNSQKNLTFNVSYSGHTILLSEQVAPGDSSNVTDVYYEGLGLRPIAQIQTHQGLAAIVNFYSNSDYASSGQDAVLATKGTLLIARPDSNLSLEQWKAFLNGLKASR